MTTQRICFVVSSSLTARAFLTGHFAALGRRYAIDLAANAGGQDGLGDIMLHVRVVPVRILRRIAPMADLVALYRLYRLFRRERYAAVSSVTPKAGLLALLAAAATRIPLRIHIFTGQVWTTRTGWKRALLKAADRLMASLATHVLADSPSQRDFLVAEGVAPAGKVRVLGEGSICGVDGERFRPDAGRRTDIRHTHGIPEEAVVFLFLGRLNRDKGVADLAEAFASLDHPAAYLLVVGPDEEGMREAMLARLGAAAERCRFVGFTDRPEDCMAAGDVFCLPSYREGFGMVVIEAAAAGLPAIASRIYGVIDAVEDGVTGLLHAPGDVGGMAALMNTLARDPTRRAAMGQAARERALRLFASQTVTQAWLDFYRQLLG
ncbi:glycosyltransferase [Candidatus Desulfobacillus denitrificans]|uniref:Glycosyltransferase n=1 Tax=Candidatus Desulfobacillus denitrificans TaxID=2608985 RepID=A0A809S204_9PROT|nr:glycosyltransferase [Candidatus Desulfobacillus denitrificans]GIK45752.1 MAG: glycosyl transferase family 1 [Betaproteobacteria bacterium]